MFVLAMKESLKLKMNPNVALVVGLLIHLYIVSVNILASQSSQTTADGKLNFNEFDISVVLEKGEKLLGSAGDEFDVEDDANIAGG